MLLTTLSAAPAAAAAVASAVRSRVAATAATATRTLIPLDIAIVGAGVSGAALACALGNSPILSSHSIALIDAGTLDPTSALYRPDPGHFSNRVVSLAPRSVQFLQSLGAWDKLPADRKHPYSSMKVWDACDNGSASFYSSAVGADAIAHMVEIPALRSALVESLPSTVERIAPASLAPPFARAAESTDNYPILPLADGSAITARLVIAADGAGSLIRTHLMPSVPFFGHDYNAAAIVATMHIEPTDKALANSTAWQRFLPTGPIAMLPLAPNVSSLVWSMPRECASALLANTSADEFAALVNAAFFYPPDELEMLMRDPRAWGDDLIGALEWRDGVHEAAVDLDTAILPPYVTGIDPTSRAAFPLRVRHALEYTGDRVALLGDAAHVIHPLAGQGLNLGLADAECLASVLSEAAAEGADIGHPHVLERYPSKRYAANAAMLSACDGLHYLFGTDSRVVAWTRSAGLNTFDGWQWVKRRAMQFAMGK
ncbi:hypothetical protein BCR44DRAFT_1513642 [Catenaria anguillulae PL171]|uniref:Ubiquinone biosynthesis monooxygenase COQ6, mitochondrial n=1 Tax=Catenaria anguillulae PL171 TaxID=765915 RepID=A0A1Y2HJY0_9FUNG|nr:hypothetical protein BCR44DRAFT_1513642 [Catenaria anguillulae PL171]